ncbi:MAG: hypothetical protein Q7T61_00905 [Caulobacter sp.]|nr:hypothetical protein [Caulobacter sp.]
MRKLEPLSPQTRIANENGSPTAFEINARQRSNEAIEALASAGELADLSGGATLADVIARVNELTNIARSIP